MTTLVNVFVVDSLSYSLFTFYGFWGLMVTAKRTDKRTIRAISCFPRLKRHRCKFSVYFIIICYL